MYIQHIIPKQNQSFLKHNYDTINPEKVYKDQMCAWICIKRQKWLSIHSCLHNKANTEMRPNDSIRTDVTSPSWEMREKNFLNGIFFSWKHCKYSHCPVFHAFLSLNFYFFLEYTLTSSTWELLRTLLLRFLIWHDFIHININFIMQMSNA